MDGKKTKFLHQPEYPGGPKALSAFIYQQLQYPKMASEANIEGIVLIEYDIDSKGTVIETRLLQGLGYGCDDEARRVVSLLKFHVPRNRGVRVIFHKKIHIHFKKPVEQPAATDQVPGQSFQMNYTITTATSGVKEENTDVKPPTTYTYTIQL